MPTLPTATTVVQPNQFAIQQGMLGANLPGMTATPTTYAATEGFTGGNVTAPTAASTSVGTAYATPSQAITSPNGTAANFNTTRAMGAPTIYPREAGPASYTATPAQQAGNITAGNAAAGAINSFSAAPQYANPQDSQVTVPTDTVAGQVKNLIDADSPLMRQAVARANARMNARGLLNSTQGVTAAESALYDAAVPIATADANIYNTTRLTNQQARNTAEMQNSQLGTDASKFNASQAQQASAANAQLATDVSKFNVTNALQAGIVNQEQANRMAQFNATLLTEASKTNAMNEQDMSKFVLDQYLKAGIINQEQYNKMSQFNAALETDTAKTNAANAQDMEKFNAANNLQAQATNQAQGNEMARFNAANAQQASTANAQLNTDVAKFNADAALRAGLVNQDQFNQMTKFNATLLTDTAKTNAMNEQDLKKFLLDENLKAGIINQDQFNRMSQFNTEQYNRTALAQQANSTDIAKFNANASNELTKMGLEGNIKTGLVDLENRYKVLMQSSATASDLYKQVTLNMSNIMQNKDVPAEQKNDALFNQLTMLNNGLSLTANIGGIGLGNLLTFEDVPRPGYSNWMSQTGWRPSTGPTATVNTSGVSPLPGAINAPASTGSGSGAINSTPWTSAGATTASTTPPGTTTGTGTNQTNPVGTQNPVAPPGVDSVTTNYWNKIGVQPNYSGPNTVVGTNGVNRPVDPSGYLLDGNGAVQSTPDGPVRIVTIDGTQLAYAGKMPYATLNNGVLTEIPVRPPDANGSFVGRAFTGLSGRPNTVRSDGVILNEAGVAQPFRAPPENGGMIIWEIGKDGMSGQEWGYINPRGMVQKL